MWVLATGEGAELPFTFRILPGNIKTVGRAPRADFIVDAPLVSRVHCRLTAGARSMWLAAVIRKVNGRRNLSDAPHHNQ